MKNPGFEDGWTDWKHSDDCVIVSDVVHSGSKAVHCKDTNTSRRAQVWQIPLNLTIGLKYRLNAFLKVKDVSGGTLLLCAEGGPYGVYGSSRNIPGCENGTCVDKWYEMSGESEKYFGEYRMFEFVAALHDKEALGEYWIDDLTVEVLRTDILGYIETTAWKQEAFEDEIEIYVNLLINGSIWHDGNGFTLTIEMVNEAGTVVDTLTEFDLGYREDLRIATFKYNPSDLKPGFYKVRAKLVNHVFDDFVETIETNLRKLEKKRDLTFYFDQKTLVAYENGKPFFPLGISVDRLVDEDLDLIIDSPFNLITLNVIPSKEKLDHVYERSGGRIRVIPNLGVNIDCNASPSDLEENYKEVVERIMQWRESPGLFGYYIADEPLACATPQMRNITLTIRDLDPNRMTYAAVNRRNETHILKEGFDAVGMDSYPLQYYYSINGVYVYSSMARQRTCNARARWDIPQIFDWEAFKHLVDGRPPYDKISIHDERPPNEQQLRQMTYQFIASGGSGIKYYGLTAVKKMDSKNPFIDEWNKIKKVAKELNDIYAPIIVSGYPGSPRFSLQYPEIRFVPSAIGSKNYAGVRKFYYKGYSYFLIVNLRAQDQQYTFFKPEDIPNSDIQMIMGSANMTFENNTVVLQMPPIDVVWLKVYDKEWLPDQHSSSESSKSSGTQTLSSCPEVIRIPRWGIALIIFFIYLEVMLF